MFEQVRRPANDGQTEPDTVKAAFLGRIDPMKFLEDFLLPVGGDPNPCIPHFQSDHHSTAPASQQDTAAGGVAHSIAQQVCGYLVQQHRIAENIVAAAPNAQTQSAILRQGPELGFQPVERIFSPGSFSTRS